jgi:hypothetical protein
MRSGERPFDAGEVRCKVTEYTRARLDYDTLRVVFRDGRFEYVAVASEKS